VFHSEVHSRSELATGETWEVKSHATGGAVRAGHAGQVTASTWIYPLFSLSFAVSDRRTSTTPSRQRTVVAVGIFMPLVVEVAPHLLLGFGPFFSHDIVGDYDTGGSNRATTVGAESLVGGWF